MSAISGSPAGMVEEYSAATTSDNPAVPVQSLVSVVVSVAIGIQCYFVLLCAIFSTFLRFGAAIAQ